MRRMKRTLIQVSFCLSLEEKGPVAPLFDVFLTCGFSCISSVFLLCED